MGIVTLSAEDLPETVLLDTWVQNPENIDTLGTFATEYMPKSLSWIHSKTKTPHMSGFVTNVLKNLTGSSTKEEFCVRLVYSVGFTLPPELQSDFANKVFEWSDIYIPNGEDSKYCFFNKFRNAVEIFKSDDEQIVSNEFKVNRLIQTAKMKTYTNVMNTFLDQNVPFIMIGPSGSGKRLVLLLFSNTSILMFILFIVKFYSLLLQNIVDDMGAHELVTINCSAQLTVKYVLYILKQVSFKNRLTHCVFTINCMNSFYSEFSSDIR